MSITDLVMSEMASLKKTKKKIFLLFFYIPSAVLLYIQRVVKIKILEHNITFFFDINTAICWLYRSVLPEQQSM